MKLFKNFYLLSCLFFMPAMHAVIVGSNESVSVQSHVTFPAADADNAVQAFAWMKNGFSLENDLTSMSFASLYPVSGILDFNDGTIILNQDLILKDAITWNSFGTINGQGLYSLDVTKAVLNPVSLFLGSQTFQDLFIYISDNFTIPADFHFKGNCTVYGTGITISVIEGISSIIVDPGSTLTLTNMIINGVEGMNIRCADDSATLILNNVTIIQQDDFSFSQGAINFSGQVNWQGTFTFLYDSSQTSTVLSNSVFHLNENLTFFLGKSSLDATVQPLNFINDTAVLWLDDANMKINENGFLFTKGTLRISNQAVIDISQTTTAGSLMFGDGIPADDCIISFDPASVTEFTLGYVHLNVTNQTFQESINASAILVRDEGNTFFIDQDVILSTITLQEAQVAPVVIAPGKTAFFDEVTIVTNGTSFILTGYHPSLSDNLLNGNNTLFLNSGSLPFTTLVNNNQNIISGSGNINAPIILQDNNAQIILDLNGRLDQDIIMNGGNIFFQNAIQLGHDVIFSGSGSVHLNDHTLIMGYVETAWPNQIEWDGDIGVISLNSDITLSSVWTFSGNCILDGSGNSLNFTDSGALCVAQGSTLKMRNISLNAIKTDNIHCLDNEAKIIVDNVLWNQDDNFTFTLGSIVCVSSVNIKGGFIFSYQSTQTMAILQDSTLLLDAGCTFSYDTSFPDLLQLESTSQIILAGGNLAAGKDLALTKGILNIQNFGSLLIESGAQVTFGDCINTFNDLQVNIQGGAQLDVNQGILNYKNVNSSSLLMQNFFSNIFMHNGTTLNLYQNMNVGTGFITFGNATLATAPGVSLLGALNEQGVLTFASLPSC